MNTGEGVRGSLETIGETTMKDYAHSHLGISFHLEVGVDGQLTYAMGEIDAGSRRGVTANMHRQLLDDAG